RVLFTADLVNNKTVPVLYQGGIDSWIDQLRGLRARFPDAETIAPGHGAPGPFDELVADEIAWLSLFRDQVQDALWQGDGNVTAEGAGAVRAAMTDAFPDWRTSAGVPSRDALIDLNIGWTLRGWRLAEDGGGPRQFREDAE
ncbi:MAG: hypothetical protein AAF317_21140, partial [Pseudomonadota bacterium]